MDANGGNQFRVTDNTANDGQPSWSPDGNSIAFVSTRSGNTDVFVMRPDGTGLAQLTTDSDADARQPDRHHHQLRNRRARQLAAAS
jgi:Tol biopolymer transport system component